jgi:hypothetical protein
VTLLSDPGPCPPAQTLGAFIERRLDADSRKAMMMHLATCVECGVVLGEVSRFLNNDDEASEEATEFDEPPRGAPLTAVAAAACSLLLLTTWW